MQFRRKKFDAGSDGLKGKVAGRHRQFSVFI
jgi:hypothetical protein